MAPVHSVLGKVFLTVSCSFENSKYFSFKLEEKKYSFKPEVVAEGFDNEVELFFVATASPFAVDVEVTAVFFVVS